MKTSKYFLVLIVAVALVTVWFAGYGHAENKTGPMAARVAVIDIVKVFNEFQRTKEVSERLNKEQAELQNQRKLKIDRIDALKAQLDNLNPDSPDFYKRQKELLALSIELKNFTDLSTENLKTEFRVQTEDIYKEMLKAIESVAKEQGYDLILYQDTMDIHGDSWPVLLEKIRERKVLYSAKQIDVTRIVLDYINQAYKLKKQ
jgi:Skp family chaperone for outer membrane proteins